MIGNSIDGIIGAAKAGGLEIDSITLSKKHTGLGYYANVVCVGSGGTKYVFSGNGIDMKSAIETMFYDNGMFKAVEDSISDVAGHKYEPTGYCTRCHNGALDHFGGGEKKCSAALVKSLGKSGVVKVGAPVCTCDLIELLRYGCRCGAMKTEKGNG